MKSKIIILLVALAVFSVGCKNVAEKAVEKAIEKESGGKARVNANDGTIEVETDKGKVQIGKNDLPEGFPEDVPVYRKAKIVSSVNNQDTYQITFSAEGKKMDEISDFYKEELEGNGWKSDSSSNSNAAGQVMSGLQYEKDSRKVSVMITESGDTTAIILQTSEK